MPRMLPCIMVVVLCCTSQHKDVAQRLLDLQFLTMQIASLSRTIPSESNSRPERKGQLEMMKPDGNALLSLPGEVDSAPLPMIGERSFGKTLQIPWKILR